MQKLTFMLMNFAVMKMKVKLLSLFVLPGSKECEEILRLIKEQVEIFDITTLTGLQKAMHFNVALTTFPVLVTEEDGEEVVYQNYNSIIERL